MPRYFCEFKNCNCNKYVSNSGICLNCNHGKVWHSRIYKNNSKYNKSQFMSSRKKARQPKYVNDLLFPLIFVPKKIPIVEAVEIDPTGFCPQVCALPV